MHVPVPPDYFDACIKGAEAAGLRFLGRTVIDSDTSALRHQAAIRKTGIPATAFMRFTSLFLTLPRQALLLCATFKEEVTHDYAAADRGERLPDPRHPFWKLEIVLGAHPGLWWGGASGWVSIPKSFDGDRLPIHVQDDRSEGGDSYFHTGPSGPADDDPKVHDGTYSVLLGYHPVEPTSGLFARAMTNLVQALRPHARPGPLGRGTGNGTVFSFPPWKEFTGCEDRFWEQFPYETLNELFSAPLRRDLNDAAMHDSICR